MAEWARAGGGHGAGVVGGEMKCVLGWVKFKEISDIRRVSDACHRFPFGWSRAVGGSSKSRIQHSLVCFFILSLIYTRRSIAANHNLQHTVTTPFPSGLKPDRRQHPPPCQPPGRDTRPAAPRALSPQWPCRSSAAAQRAPAPAVGPRTRRPARRWPRRGTGAVYIYVYVMAQREWVNEERWMGGMYKATACLRLVVQRPRQRHPLPLAPREAAAPVGDGQEAAATTR